ncbi:MAG TPA: hypothetical protein VIJ94_07805 [Caulobacteraceae bacterium]
MTDRPSRPFPSLPLRRLRAVLRRMLPGGGRIEGFVDGCVAGEIRGWAMDRSRPNRRVHVVAVCDGRVVAEALADVSRADLVQDGRGDGRHAFRLRLPAALLDGEPRQVRVQVIAGGAPVRLLRGEIEIHPPALPEPSGGRRRAGTSGSAAPAEEEPSRPLVLALWPGDGEAAVTIADWRAMAAPALEVVRLGSADPATLAAVLAPAHTVIFAHPGDRIDPAITGLVSRSRPLADVLTWDGPAAASRRPEARALGLSLGESLDGAFAVRGHVVTLAGPALTAALAAGDPGRVELVLAARPELRWAHLAGRLTTSARHGATPADRPIPQYRPERLSLAIWPGWSADAEASLTALLAQAPSGVAIEVLVAATGATAARGRIEALTPAGVLVSVRAVDAPAAATPGVWLAALAAAASAELVIICQAGVRLGDAGGGDAGGGLEVIAAWASAPNVGAVTVPIRRGKGAPLAGLALERTDAGWATKSAFAEGLQGQRRPVLAAPAALLAIGRDKLAMLGGVDADRLPAGAADLDLGLRLRRIGLPCVLLGDLAADAGAGIDLSGEIAGSALAAFDATELAAAAGAYPAPPDR